MNQSRRFVDFDIAVGGVLPAAPVLLLGVPIEAEGMRAGCSEAPDAIRRASAALPAGHVVKGLDMGNLPLDDDWRAPVRDFVSLSIGQGSIPVLLGGGPEVAGVALEAVEDLPVVAATHVLRPGLAERNAVWIGLNGPQDARLWDELMEGSQAFLTARQVEDGATIEYPDQAFLWIDAAVLDTGHAAGAADINPGGLAPDALMKAIGSLRGRIRGIVITGATPARDPRGLTEFVLASAIREFLGND